MTSLFHADPALLEFAWSMAVAALAVISTALALVLLPWTDAECAEVDAEARQLLRPALRRATTLIR
jgi:hypothetical protein